MIQNVSLMPLQAYNNKSLSGPTFLVKKFQLYNTIIAFFGSFHGSI